jgi:CubicO group peptidase (beta-lactamase class C family)
MTDVPMVKMSSGAKTRLNAIVEARVTNNKCPSLFATIFQGGTELFQVGFGESRVGTRTPDSSTVYRIASCSKSFTVAMLLLLRDRGLVSLEAPITDFVPEFTQSTSGPAYEPPTLRMLMSMSGGLPTDDPWADRQESISNADLRDSVTHGVLLTSAPGTQFQYSNLGYALLGQVVESVAQRPFQVLVRDEIILPLGLGDTGYSEDLVEADHLALGYRRRDDEWVELPFSGPGAFSCIGGLFSSGRDLSAWVRWLASALGDRPDETGPLSVASRREMQQIVTAIPFASTLATLSRNATRYVGYGLGLFSEFDKRWGQFVSHSGGYPGFSAHMRWHAPTGLGVVVVENATYSGAWETATELIELVLDDANFQLPTPNIWTPTYDMAGLADALVRNWEDPLAWQIFAENVALDTPFDERRAHIVQLVDEVGGLTESVGLRIEIHKSESPLHVVWTIPGRHGTLRCEIRLSPIEPSLIQTLNVTKESSH